MKKPKIETLQRILTNRTAGMHRAGGRPASREAELLNGTHELVVETQLAWKLESSGKVTTVATRTARWVRRRPDSPELTKRLNTLFPWRNPNDQS